MAKFLVLYHTPTAVLDGWMQKPEEERKDAEAKMMSDWNAWMQKTGSHLLETAGVSAPKRITTEGATDARNDIMMYSMVEADSKEEAAQLFEGNPHFGISESWIEVMQVNPIPGA